MKPNKILVINGDTYSKPVASFGEITYELTAFTREPELFKLLVFTGGEDVDPSMYGETSPKGVCHFNHMRDRRERLIFRRAVKNKIKMTGICRGSQFLNVMSGGRLMHHITGHAMWETHELKCHVLDKNIRVNSLHHQMIIPPPNGYIIAWCPTPKSNIYLGDRDLPVRWPGPEVEGIYIPETKVCAVQWHPEMMSVDSDGFKLYEQMMADFLDMPEEEFSKVYTGRKNKAKAGFV
jgi:GMP synthase-like glutamine amidotransferase